MKVNVKCIGSTRGKKWYEGAQQKKKKRILSRERKKTLNKAKGRRRRVSLKKQENKKAHRMKNNLHVYYATRNYV